MPAELTADILDELSAKATAGPWCVESATGELTDIALAYEIPNEGSPIVIAHCWPSDREDEDEGDAITYKAAKANTALIIYLRNHADEISKVIRERDRLREALQSLADNNLNDSNCASVELAGKRVRNIATKALEPKP